MSFLVAITPESYSRPQQAVDALMTQVMEDGYENLHAVGRVDIITVFTGVGSQFVAYVTLEEYDDIPVSNPE